MGATDVVRGLLVAVGLLLVVGGFAVLGQGGQLGLGGLAMIVQGGFLLVVAVLERNRYRSEAAERAGDSPGVGAGETGGPVEARFQPTNEVFVDPTTQRRMRVLVDPRTGERRYVAED